MVATNMSMHRFFKSLINWQAQTSRSGNTKESTARKSILPSIAGIKPEDYVILDSRLVKNKGDAYYNAMERFRNGATLTYDGVAFGFRPNNEIACGVLAGEGTLTESSAMELAEHAQSVFAQLQNECEEFASAVADHTFRISIMSGHDAHARDLCRVIDGKLQWQR